MKTEKLTIDELRNLKPGTQIKGMSFGLLVDGTVLDVSEDEHSITVSWEHKPVRRGDILFTKTRSSSRLVDNRGSANHIQIR